MEFPYNLSVTENYHFPLPDLHYTCRHADSRGVQETYTLGWSRSYYTVTNVAFARILVD